MKLAVLSDTHGLLGSEVKKIISECDAVLHAGDIASQKIIDEIEKAKRADAPLYIVRGNNDKEWGGASAPSPDVFPGRRKPVSGA